MSNTRSSTESQSKHLSSKVLWTDTTTLYLEELKVPKTELFSWVSAVDESAKDWTSQTMLHGVSSLWAFHTRRWMILGSFSRKTIWTPRLRLLAANQSAIHLHSTFRANNGMDSKHRELSIRLSDVSSDTFRTTVQSYSAIKGTIGHETSRKFLNGFRKASRCQTRMNKQIGGFVHSTNRWHTKISSPKSNNSIKSR